MILSLRNGCKFTLNSSASTAFFAALSRGAGQTLESINGASGCNGLDVIYSFCISDRRNRALRLIDDVER